MTETSESTDKAPRKRAGGLNAMLLADLKAMAGGMGIKGAGSMKKAQLVDAIKSAQAGSSPAAPAQPAASKAGRSTSSGRADAEADADAAPDRAPAAGRAPEPAEPDRAHESGPQPEQRSESKQDRSTEQQPEQRPESKQDRSAGQRPESKQDRSTEQRPESKQDPKSNQGNQGNQGNQDPEGEGEGRTGRNRRRRGRDRTKSGQPDGQAPAAQHGQPGGQQPQAGGGPQSHQGGPQGGSRGGQGNRHEPDTTILEDDIIVPAAGILDVLDNYAFVRTSGYLPGPDDVYLSLSMVRKFGLRRGDAIVGQVRHPREGERREKFNPMVRIDSVNGHDPDTAKTRVDFAKLTPLHPSERLRLETDATNLVGRLIDLAAPIGKGQRGLIVSPAKAGKTTILQSIASSISANNPECHLMVVLVDERPEEVTDFERSVKGEVIASTFDRPAADHTTIAELAIERAKRLVELGHDVVVLLDGLTRLGRAYNLSLPTSGRILSGMVDAGALHPPKKFFGAARNIENGGSLTILATALVETGSATDEVFFEELRDTANMEVRLRSELAGRRLFPAIDAVASGTRREELLLGEQEVAIVWKLRRALSSLESPQALELLLERLKKSHSNIELLTQVQRADPAGQPGQER